MVCVYKWIGDKKFKQHRATLRDGLRDHLTHAPPTAQRVIGGDFNSEVGTRTPPTDDWHAERGPYGNAKQSYSGNELLHLCAELKLYVADTFSPQSKQGTWINPDGARTRGVGAA